MTLRPAICWKKFFAKMKLMGEVKAQQTKGGISRAELTQFKSHRIEEDAAVYEEEADEERGEDDSVVVPEEEVQHTEATEAGSPMIQRYCLKGRPRKRGHHTVTQSSQGQTTSWVRVVDFDGNWSYYTATATKKPSTLRHGTGWRKQRKKPETA